MRNGVKRRDKTHGVLLRSALVERNVDGTPSPSATWRRVLRFPKSTLDLQRRFSDRFQVGTALLNDHAIALEDEQGLVVTQMATYQQLERRLSAFRLNRPPHAPVNARVVPSILACFRCAANLSVEAMWRRCEASSRAEPPDICD